MKKNIIKYILTVFAIVSLLTYCKDDSGDALPEVKSSDTLTEGLTAKIGDSVWIPEVYQAYKANGYINFTASSDTGAYIAFSIAATVPGVYTFGSNSLNTAIFKPDFFGSVNYLSYGVASNKESSKTGGMVYISSCSIDSGVMSGSFIFTMFNSKSNSYVTISEGTFNNIPYAESGSINNGVKAIMNEKDWTASEKVSAKYIDSSNLVIQIVSGNNEILELNLQKLAKTTFNINASSPNSAIYFLQNHKAVFSSNGSINSIGKVEITGLNTTDSLISGKFFLSIHNPLTKEERFFRTGSFNNIKYQKVNSNSLRKNFLNASINEISWTSPYLYGYENLNDTIQLIATDGLGKARMRLSVPKDTINGKSIIEAFYYDASGKIYISQSGEITITKKDTISRSIGGIFNFESLNSINGASTSISEGKFEVYY